MYQSTPQHVIDEESHPGVLAEIMNSSSSSGSSSSSNSTDSEDSSDSHTTAKRIKRVLRGRRRRKSSASSKDTPSVPSTLRTPSIGANSNTNGNSESTVVESLQDMSNHNPSHLGAIASGDEADTDGEHGSLSVGRGNKINFRDFETETAASGSKTHSSVAKKKTKRKRRDHTGADERDTKENTKGQAVSTVKTTEPSIDAKPSTPRVGFAKETEGGLEVSPKRPFGKRGISNVLPAMPAMPRMLSTTVFSTANPSNLPESGVPAPFAPFAARSTLHRSSSLPGRLNRINDAPTTAPEQPLPYVRPVTASHPSLDAEDTSKLKKNLSRTSSIILLLVSTGLVAICADFLVNSINHLVTTTDVSEAFIGLIILPIVGNAAEHVTAVVVASKNKMDLAIGVAVGSSIQIALFVTPVIVLLGWILQKDMSLYFSLFETISLFVSAFIVNFLVLDGRSNYLEGALLIAAYVIIAVAAFFYPDSGQQSMIGGA
ncbi:MAG: hypothetical protein Q9190_000611 [Brigantiaea leucoxantha]